ncbi:hypothetical protein [uncultured Holdemanella sp.]|nr:hypothetical protein [uncultured Holdemanella sp.]
MIEKLNEKFPYGQVYLYFHGALEGKKMDVLRKNKNLMQQYHDEDFNLI